MNLFGVYGRRNATLFRLSKRMKTISKTMIVFILILTVGACNLDEQDNSLQAPVLSVFTESITISTLYNDETTILEVQVMNDTDVSDASNTLMDDKEIEYTSRKAIVNKVIHGKTTLHAGDEITIAMRAYDKKDPTYPIYDSAIGDIDINKKAIVYVQLQAKDNVYFLYHKGMAFIDLSNVDLDHPFALLSLLHYEDIVDRDVFKTMIQEGMPAIKKDSLHYKSVTLLDHDLQLTYLFDESSDTTLLLFHSASYSFKGKLFP